MYANLAVPKTVPCMTRVFYLSLAHVRPSYPHPALPDIENTSRCCVL